MIIPLAVPTGFSLTSLIKNAAYSAFAFTYIFRLRSCISQPAASLWLVYW